MRTFSEFLNQKPSSLNTSWEKVEDTWEGFLQELHNHLRDNMTKYDAHHSKFGDLSGEHPDKHLDRVVKIIEKGFEKMKEGLTHLGAYEII